MPYERVDSDPPDHAVRRLTFVPFLGNGDTVAIPGQGDRLTLPSGAVEPAEHWLLDASLRIPLTTAGFRIQRVHTVGVESVSNGLHLYAFCEGAPYRGRRPHTPVDLAQQPAEELAARVDPALRQVVLDAAEDYCTQTEESYHADSLRLIEPAYLREETPEGGSGCSGDTPATWRAKRESIIDGVTRDGTFLDLGCANGHLMACVHTWAAERGIRLEPYGVDIGPGLVDLARKRLPRWADRIEQGNALTWTPGDGRRFTYVHLLLDFVLPHRRRELLDHALDALTEPGGRLLVSHYVAAHVHPNAAEIVTELGFEPAGTSGSTAWIDRVSS